jgi:tetratricopeptide (TPR) repeat protein
MTTGDHPTDPNAETIGLPSDDSGKGSVPEPGKFATQGIPTEIGRYRILGVIASGGMGVVYEAMQEAPRRRVGLKVIKIGAASEMALHRFQFEAQTLAKLSHPNIAQIYEAGMWESESGEAPFFAMEYIPGARGIVSYAEKKNLSMKDRLVLFAKICDAVHHAHQKGIIHRDLKPDNILVDSNGDPKIIDFGVARATDADLAVTTMQTTMGQLIGTLQYMSPEQCDADPDQIDTRSDVYALGVILFELLSGKLPYDLRRQAVHEAVRIIKEERPTSMGTINTSLKGDVDTIALKAMEKNSDRRYQSAAELANDINHFLNNEPIIARPLSIGYQVRLFTKKYKRTCAAVFLLAISIVLGIFGTTWGMVEANHQKTIAIEQRNLAENRYDAILDISKDVIGGFYSGIVKLNAAMDVRKLVLDSSMKHLEELETTAGQTQKIRTTKANMHTLYGNYYAARSGANMGDIPRAIQEHELAIQLYNELITEGLTKLHFNVALNYSYLAHLAMMSKEYGKSLKLLDKAKRFSTMYLLETPDDINAQRLDSRIFMSKYDVLTSLDRNDEAKSELDENLALRKRRAQESPNNVYLLRDYANILQRVGGYHLQQKEYEKSIEQYEIARDLYLNLMNTLPENGQAVRDLAWGDYFLGEAFIENGQHDDGLGRLEFGISLIRDRCVSDTTDARTRNDIPRYVGAYVYKCGELEMHDRAKKTCYNVLLVLQPVIEGNPSNYALAEMYANLQKLHDEIGQVAAANQ